MKRKSLVLLAASCAAFGPLWSAYAAPAETGSEPYGAVPFILDLREAGIGKGGGDGRFEWDAPVQRKEAALRIARGLPPMNTGIAGGVKAPFSDIAELTDEEQWAISLVYNLGIMMGDGTQFRPCDELTRSEAADIAERLLQRIRNQSGGKEMAFQKVDLETTDPAIQKWVSEKRGKAGLHSATIENRTYILASRGEKPSSGYEISIDKIVERPDRILVYVKFRDPEPGKSYLTVITTPADLVEIQRTEKPIELQRAIR